MTRPRKSSACVTLVLIGAAALAGCSDDSATNRRSAYASREACLADWNDPKDCEERQATGWDGSRHSYWYGGGGSHGGPYGGGSSSGSSGHSISHGGFGAHGSSSS